jgi:uncharacterized protein
MTSPRITSPKRCSFVQHEHRSVTVALALIIAGSGVAAGGVGALLGIGGGVFLVPLLHVALGFPLRTAAAISLSTVIATSSSVSAGRSGEHLINLRLVMVLEVATVGGSLLGGLTAHLFSETTLQRLFGIVAVLAAAAVLARVNRRNVVLDPAADPGMLGGRFHEDESRGTVTYRVTRLPVALLLSFAAGNVSSLLGIGGGVLKVPALNAWCGVPMRAAAATSAFMIGVTAAGGAIIYYGRGDLPALAAAPAVLGVQLGSWIGVRFAGRIPARWLKLLLVAVLLMVSALMFMRSAR